MKRTVSLLTAALFAGALAAPAFAQSPAAEPSAAAPAAGETSPAAMSSTEGTAKPKHHHRRHHKKPMSERLRKLRLGLCRARPLLQRAPATKADRISG